MPTVAASASDTATLEAAKPKPRTVTAPNPARASAFRREIASGLAISVMSTLHVRRPMLPKLTSPVLTCVSPQGGARYCIAAGRENNQCSGRRLDRTGHSGQRLRAAKYRIPAPNGGVFRKRANEWFLWSFWYSQDLRRERRTTAFS